MGVEIVLSIVVHGLDFDSIPPQRVSWGIRKGISDISEVRDKVD
jgi:hypothetical protein